MQMDLEDATNTNKNFPSDIFVSMLATAEASVEVLTKKLQSMKQECEGR